MTFLDLTLLGLATWRTTSLLSCENGPYDFLLKLRHKLGVRYSPEPPYAPYGTNELAKGLVCPWCASVWIGAFWTVVYLLAPEAALILALPLALSSLAILWEEVVRK